MLNGHVKYCNNQIIYHAFKLMFFLIYIFMCKQKWSGPFFCHSSASEPGALPGSSASAQHRAECLAGASWPWDCGFGNQSVRPQHCPGQWGQPGGREQLRSLGHERGWRCFWDYLQPQWRGQPGSRGPWGQSGARGEREQRRPLQRGTATVFLA